MTVIVSVKVNDGIVMAADSFTSLFENGEKFIHQFSNAHKIINLHKSLKIGAMTTGAGNIGSSSISTLSKELRLKFSGKDKDKSYKLEPDKYTIEEVAKKSAKFLQQVIVDNNAGEVGFIYRVCGYSASASHPEIWNVNFINGKLSGIDLMQGQGDHGIHCGGEFDFFMRLINGASIETARYIVNTNNRDESYFSKIFSVPGAFLQMTHPAMPLQDAIDLADFIVKVGIGVNKFTIGHNKTVGGDVDIAAITKHEGFKWVKRKHFYPQILNQ